MNVIFHIYPRRWCSDCRLSCDVPSAAVSPSSKQQSNPLRWKHIKDSRAKGDSGSPRFPCRVCVRGISSSLKHNIIKCFMCLQKMHRRLLSTMAYFDFAVKGEGEKNTPIPSGRLFVFDMIPNRSTKTSWSKWNTGTSGTPCFVSACVVNLIQTMPLYGLNDARISGFWKQSAPRNFVVFRTAVSCSKFLCSSAILIHIRQTLSRWTWQLSLLRV